MMQPSTKERAHGRWRQILPALGIDDSFLTGRNCPCPICGGTDRFRFIDRQPGNGMWVCNQCQPRPRPAIDLVIAFTGKPFPEAARVIDDILGDRHVKLPAPTTIRPIEQKASKYYHQKVWRRGGRIRADDAVDKYLHHRGVGMDIYPPTLRISPLDWYREHPNAVQSRHPAMFALVTDPAGKHVSTHRTFLAGDGMGKANVATPRKMAGPSGRGPTIRLMPAAPLMGIAEGIETALSAARLFRIPVWSVLCAHGIETFEPPPGCRHLIVFADHDPHGVSQRAAEALCARLSFPTEIKIPDQPDTDWNDVLVETAR
jgi:putative DNA primase/helicase